MGKIDDHNHDAEEEWKGKKWESWGRSQLHAPHYSLVIQPLVSVNASATTVISHFRVLSWRPRSMNPCRQVTKGHTTFYPGLIRMWISFPQNSEITEYV